jgi:Na+/H+ antiporter NhaD/arsenite permease-like protein
MLTFIIIVFVVGYLAIAFEHYLHLNKAASALLTGTLCWVFYIFTAGSPEQTHYISEELLTHLGEISGILFFLLGAMTIVELIDAHDGFDIITKSISTTSKRKLLWIISFFSFFLSSVLDNLTTTIVMVSLIRKLIPENKDRLLFVGMVIIAANAGGAWSPIGDVTTTMLWIGNQITTTTIIANLFFPSLVCLLVPLLFLSFSMKGNIQKLFLKEEKLTANSLERKVIFFSGIAILLLIPVFKTLTHLPPFMGMLLGLGLLWLISEILHRNKDTEDKTTYSVVYALQKIDTPSILFFLGILISVSALQSAGHLGNVATFMDEKIGNINVMVMLIGLLSAVIDNVPLVAAAMGMYDLHTFPTDHNFWIFLAYCTGTGGSVLIIGSAAGVAAMGMEKIDFFWYMKKISWLALLGYFSGAAMFILQCMLFEKV